MEKLARQIGTIVAIAAVLTVFLAPAFAAQPTALRASRAAQQLLLAFALTALVLANCLHHGLSVLRPCHAAAESIVLPPDPRVIDLICARLC
jgi:hypothetical protein